MTEASLEGLEFLRDKKEYLESRLRNTNRAIKAIRDICDHKYPDGASALSCYSDGAWCSICEKKV